MISGEKIEEHRKLFILGMIFFSILVNGGFFPIVNFNPENPVDLGGVLRLLIIVMAFVFHKEVGKLEAVLFSERSIGVIGLFNMFLVLCGLIFRYLLEFGGVSNSYNFTLWNVLFQVAMLSLISTVVCLSERQKKTLSQ